MFFESFFSKNFFNNGLRVGCKKVFAPRLFFKNKNFFNQSPKNQDFGPRNFFQSKNLFSIKSFLLNEIPPNYRKKEKFISGRPVLVLSVFVCISGFWFWFLFLVSVFGLYLLDLFFPPFYPLGVLLSVYVCGFYFLVSVTFSVLFFLVSVFWSLFWISLFYFFQWFLCSDLCFTFSVLGGLYGRFL